MRYISNHSSAREFISTRREFNGSSMSGRKSPTGDVGKLPREWRDVYYNVVNEIDYIVYSWRTPIAWHTREGLWYLPRVSYSTYSARHQAYAFGVAKIENEWYQRIECDIYYTAYQIMQAVHTWRETGRATIMHTRRRQDRVTVRGIRAGDYVASDIGWIPVSSTERVKGVFGTYYWRARCHVAGELFTVYIGDHTERIARLRA